MSRVRLSFGIAMLASGTFFGMTSTGVAQTKAQSVSQPVTQTSGAVLADRSAKSPAEEIDRWIEQLGDSNYFVRELAAQQLERAGLASFEKLRVATSHANVEIATTAQFLINSMRVFWSLDTDSLEVKRLLKDYNELSVQARLERLQRLAERSTDDAWLALVRLSQYEGNEVLSKNAALFLLGIANDNSRDISITHLREVIASGLGKSDRAAMKWLQAFIDENTPSSKLFETWSPFLDRERGLLESNSDLVDSQTMKRLYRWTAQWLTRNQQTRDAMEIVPQLVELVGQNQDVVENEMIWMLEAGLYEGPQLLQDQWPNLIKKNIRLQYLVAESYLKSNQLPKAEKLAEDALDAARIGGAFLPAVQKGNHEAYQRHDVATFLNERGLYDWADRELVRSISSGPSPEMEYGIRAYAAECHAADEDYDKAAEVLLPMVNRWADPKDVPEYFQRADEDGSTPLEILRGTHHYYRGLDYKKRGEIAAARAELLLAIDEMDTNPDFLIALSKVIGEDVQAREKYQQKLTAMIETYRQNILSKEAEIALTPDRQSRSRTKQSLAMYYNQLAWLLAGVNVTVDEAVRLSERSLTMVPNYAVYLDTLARCYFVSGNVQKAVEIQGRAVKLEPYERQMRRQLKEFEQAAGSSK